MPIRQAMVDFSSLPTEIKLNVFAFVRPTRDKKHACMVSKEWAHMMAPILWEYLAVDLKETNFRRLATLLDPGNGILPHVRRLYLRASKEDREYPEMALVLLLNYLPRDRLKVFSAYAIKPCNLTLLLKQQCQLGKLEAPLLLEPSYAVDRVSMLSKVMNSWNRSSLENITTLATYIRTDNTSITSYEPFRDLLAKCPRVASLTICEHYIPGYPECANITSALPLRLSPSSPLLLTHLRLVHLRLGTSSAALLLEVNMSTLRDLDISGCDELMPFLSALTTAFSRSGSSLEVFNVRYQWTYEKHSSILKALDYFLQSFQGLRVIGINMDLQELIPKEGIMHHADTLELLLLGTEKEAYQLQYNSHIIDISRRCVRLQDIGVCLGPCDMSHWFGPNHSFHLEDHDPCLVGASLKLCSSKSRSQQGLAKLPKLRTLRMLNLPTMDYDLKPQPENDSFSRVAITDGQVSVAQELMHKWPLTY